MRRTGLVIAVLLLGCADPEVAGPVEGSFVIARLAVDPATELGDIFFQEGTGPAEDGVIAETMNAVFDASACWAGLSLVLQIEGTRDSLRGSGEVSLLLVTKDGAGDLCGGGFTAAVQPASYRPDVPGEPYVRGPAFFEGRTLDARLSLGDIPIPNAGLFPRWWSLRARISPPGEPLTMSDAELSTVWLAGERLLLPVPGMAPEADGRLLDQLVRRGHQPDVDMDGDGLERFEDVDGDGLVDACLDGAPAGAVGERFEGADCARRPEIADGYLVRLRFRVHPVTVH